MFIYINRPIHNCSSVNLLITAFSLLYDLYYLHLKEEKNELSCKININNLLFFLFFDLFTKNKVIAMWVLMFKCLIVYTASVFFSIKNSTLFY